MSNTIGGTQLVTADAAVGVSGQPVRVYSIHILSGAGGAGVVKLYHGTSATGSYLQETGNTNDGKTVDFGAVGTFFPNGCFCDIDTNTTLVAVNCVV